MITRVYFVNARVTDQTGYSYTSKLVADKSLFARQGKVFSEVAKELKAELLKRRPDALFEIVSFNRV